MGWLNGIRLARGRIGGFGLGPHIAAIEAQLAAIEECAGQLGRSCDDLRSFLEDDTAPRWQSWVILADGVGQPLTTPPRRA